MASLAGVFAAVYWSVLVAELIGDKSIYTVTSLALRFPRRIVMSALVTAYSVKMACAAFIGGLLLRLPGRTLTLVSALGFLVSAVVISVHREEETAPAEFGWHRGAIACFASLFVTEWADPGQIVTITASAHTGMPIVVWIAASLAMMTKGMLALFVGVKLRDRVPQRMVRAVAVVSLTILGVVTLVSDITH
jgi:putative Ca2+/H+ antiporter (TMEM165/GDT1 family)